MVMMVTHYYWNVHRGVIDYFILQQNSQHSFRWSRFQLAQNLRSKIYAILRTSFGTLHSTLKYMVKLEDSFIKSTESRVQSNSINSIALVLHLVHYRCMWNLMQSNVYLFSSWKLKTFLNWYFRFRFWAGYRNRKLASHLAGGCQRMFSVFPWPVSNQLL